MNATRKLNPVCRPQVLAVALGVLLAPLPGLAQHAGHAPIPPPTHEAPSDKPMTPIPEVTDADRAAAIAPEDDHPVHDNGIFSYVLFNRLEAWEADAGTGLAWEGQSWIGTDLNRLWLRSEGEQIDGRLESADLEVLYGRSVSAWWDVVAGVRHDFRPGDSRDFLAVGVVGLAPYKFEVEATAYVGESGQTAARIEVEYETLLTNRLILQPLLEAEFNGKDDPARGVGSGLSTAEFGLRLRYEIRREIAPYIGIVRERAFGQTARFREQDGHASDDTRFVAGFRIWF
jgi:copper resistance protein B